MHIIVSLIAWVIEICTTRTFLEEELADVGGSHEILLILTLLLVDALFLLGILATHHIHFSGFLA